MKIDNKLIPLIYQNLSKKSLMLVLNSDVSILILKNDPTQFLIFLKIAKPIMLNNIFLKISDQLFDNDLSNPENMLSFSSQIMNHKGYPYLFSSCWIIFRVIADVIGPDGSFRENPGKRILEMFKIKN